MQGVNKVILIGNLGKDPELRHTKDGTPVCNFSVATSEKWKDKGSGEMVEKTEWHNVTAWKKTAELCAEYLSKGRQVYIEGKIQSREYEDRDGNKRRATDVIAQSVTFLGSRDDGQSGGGSREQGRKEYEKEREQKPAKDYNYGPPPMSDNDVPF